MSETENAYPLWFLILSYWFPAHEGYEVVSDWTPSAPGDAMNLQHRETATIAVLWAGVPRVSAWEEEETSARPRCDGEKSPVVVLQVRDVSSPPTPSRPAPSNKPARSSSNSSTKSTVRRKWSAVITTPHRDRLLTLKRQARCSAEKVFAQSALYSELPTLCVLAALGKTCWGGFVRSTDATSPEAIQAVKNELGKWEWFGPGWESSTRNSAGEGACVDSLDAFEMMGRCFLALKSMCENCRTQY